MIDNKAKTKILAHFNVVREFLLHEETAMDAGLFCYVFLVLKRPDLFYDPDPRLPVQKFQWRRFRGISIKERDIRNVQDFLDGMGKAWNYPSSSTVRANLRNRDYMQKAAWRIEYDIQHQDILTWGGLEALKRIRSGIKLSERFRRLMKFKSPLRVRDIQQHLHVTAKVAGDLIKNEERAGRIKRLQYQSGSGWIIYNKKIRSYSP